MGCRDAGSVLCGRGVGEAIDRLAIQGEMNYISCISRTKMSILQELHIGPSIATSRSKVLQSV